MPTKSILVVEDDVHFGKQIVERFTFCQTILKLDRLGCKLAVIELLYALL